MAKNIRWSPDDLKNKRYIQTATGDYVPVERVTAKKADKLPNLLERAVGGLKEGDTGTEASFKPAIRFGEESKIKFVDLFAPKPLIVMTPSYTQHHFQLPTGEMLYCKFIFDLAPCPAPRMTRSDQWKTDPYHPDPRKRQRKPVAKYFTWRNAFIAECEKVGYTLGETLRVLFIIPMPQYFSRKKRETYNGQPHKQRPDTDNMLKSIKDAFKVDDGYVWDERGVKLWGEKGQIIIF